MLQAKQTTRTGKHASLAILALTLFASGPTHAALPADGCVEFEDNSPVTLTSGSFSDSGVTMTLADFRDPNGDVVAGGQIDIKSANANGFNEAGGRGQYIEYLNKTLDFDFDRAIEDLTVLFSELNGNINLTINNDFQNTTDLADLHGQTVGGTFVEVLEGPDAFGLLRVTGTVNQFNFGGAGLTIDAVCDAVMEGDCVDFGDLVNGATYPFGHFAVDNGIPMVVDELTLANGSTVTGDGVIIGTAGEANGTGQEGQTDQVSVQLRFTPWYQNAELLWGWTQGEISLVVNGSRANVTDPNDFHNTTLGGVTLAVLVNGDFGRITLTGGVISSLAIGGEELWIDDVCVSNRIGAEIFTDGFESGDTSAWSTVVGD